MPKYLSSLFLAGLVLVACGDDDSSSGSSGSSAAGAGGSAGSSAAGAGGSAGSSAAGAGGSAGSSAAGAGGGSAGGQAGAAGSTGEPAGSCDGQSCNIPEIGTCYQWSSSDASAGKQQAELCPMLGGTVAQGPCPAKDQVAGCKTPLTGGCAISFGYSPIISDQNVKEDCDMKQGTFIDK